MTHSTKPPQLTAYLLNDDETPLPVPGQSTRDWMDMTSERYAYRCLPLTIANSSGWELRTPFAFRATWNGEQGLNAVTVQAVTPLEQEAVDRIVTSHFGHGILTFRISHLFQTNPGWGLWVRGVPNLPKHGIYPLDGLVETDWLPFTFTMNWVFTAPGTIEFQKDEPFCFITPVPHHLLDALQPVVKPLSSSPDLKKEYEEWSQSRQNFLDKIKTDDPEIKKQGWQKFYIKGQKSDLSQTEIRHVTKRKLHDFKEEN